MDPSQENFDAIGLWANLGNIGLTSQNVSTSVILSDDFASNFMDEDFTSAFPACIPTEHPTSVNRRMYCRQTAFTSFVPKELHRCIKETNSNAQNALRMRSAHVEPWTGRWNTPQHAVECQNETQADILTSPKSTIAIPTTNTQSAPYSAPFLGAGLFCAPDTQLGHKLFLDEAIRTLSCKVSLQPVDTTNRSTDMHLHLSTSQSGVTRLDPPMNDHSQGARLRRQNLRFTGDEYAATWVRGDGVERAGWCGICSSWHKLKDSAYWYHMHYSHGISCHTGKPFDRPSQWRKAADSPGQEALCSRCQQWICCGRGQKVHTSYFRHAYRCHTKSRLGHNRARSTKSDSPHNGAVQQSRSSLDN